jgi:AspT/YidE/YbjL antiporter-like protein
LSAFGVAVDYKLIGLMKDLGLVLFIFTVGLQVGPSFFSSFRKGGLKLNLLAVAIVVLGVLATVLISVFSGETLDVMAGVYSGSIGSTPGMSAAQQAVSSIGIGTEDTIANGFAVTYPIGIVGPIICCILIRNICQVSLENEPVQTVEQGENSPITLPGGQEKVVSKSLIVLFIGICLGVGLGSIPFPLGLSVPFKLGMAGGPMIVAILIGHFGTKQGYIDATVTSGATMSMLRELGISIFLGSVGLTAGGSFIDTICNGGYMWIIYGLAITMLPVLAVGIFARKHLKVNYYTIMGLAGGATTDTPALAYANSVANNPDNSLPASSYATVYPLTVFMRVFTAQMLVMIAAA